MPILQNDDPSHVETVKGLWSAVLLFNHIRVNERDNPTLPNLI